MLCMPEELREEDERLFRGFLNNRDKYTPDQYIKEFASKEHLEWKERADKHIKEARKRGIRAG